MRFRVMTPTASDAASTISENAGPGGAKASLLGLTTSALSASEAEWEEDSLDGRNHIGRSNGGVGGGSRNGRARVGFGDYTSVSKISWRTTNHPRPPRSHKCLWDNL